MLKRKFFFGVLFCLMFACTNNSFAQICAGGEEAGCGLAQSFDLTGATLTSGPNADFALSTSINYVAMEGAAAPSNCSGPYLNGYDEAAGLSDIDITLAAANTINVTGLTSVDYCFFFYNDSNIADIPADPINYSNDLEIQLVTDAGTTSSAFIAPSSLDLVALENGEWIYICQTFTLPGGATMITGMNHQVELESSLDGRCGSGYSVANTCEVFGVAPDGIATCPVEIVEPTPPTGCDADNGDIMISNN